MKIRHAVLGCLAAVLMLLGPGSGAIADSHAPGGQPWTWPLWPIPEVADYFDPPTTPYGPGHLGVDLLGYPGQPVRAAAAGTVSFAGQVAGKPVVVVDHGRERSTYEPVVAGVGRGDPVTAGQPIGTLVLTAGHCLPSACLHLGRRRGDIYLDPLELLGGGPVRLLPRYAPRAVPPPVHPAGRSPALALTPLGLAFWPAPLVASALVAAGLGRFAETGIRAH